MLRYLSCVCLLAVPSVVFAQGASKYNPDQDAYAIVQASQRVMLYLRGQEQSWQQQLDALRRQNDELQKQLAKTKAPAEAPAAVTAPPQN